MAYDVFKRRCGHGTIIGRLEHCPKCVSEARERAVAKAGPPHVVGYHIAYTRYARMPIHGTGGKPIGWTKTADQLSRFLPPSTEEHMRSFLFSAFSARSVEVSSDKLARKVSVIVELGSHRGEYFSDDELQSIDDKLSREIVPLGVMYEVKVWTLGCVLPLYRIAGQRTQR